jgi:hypothetical protein
MVIRISRMMVVTELVVIRISRVVIWGVRVMVDRVMVDRVMEGVMGWLMYRREGRVKVSRIMLSRGLFRDHREHRDRVRSLVDWVPMNLLGTFRVVIFQTVIMLVLYLSVRLSMERAELPTDALIVPPLFAELCLRRECRFPKHRNT